MGGKNSKDTKKKENKDDGCIGNRRVRTVILSIILCVFFVFATPWAANNQSQFDEWKDTPLGETACVVLSCHSLLNLECQLGTDRGCSDFVNAWSFVLAGCIISIVAAIACIVTFIACSEHMIAKIGGFTFVIGGLVYMVGWVWIIVLSRPGPDGAYFDNLSDAQKNDVNSRMVTLFGEALLAGGSAMLLGLDAAFNFYENEAYRLSSNLGIMMVTAALCMPAYYALVCSEEQEQNLECIQYDGVGSIGTGYLVLFWTALVYVILYVCTCCTCNCKDACLVRLVIAIALVIGGVLTAIGYYVYVGAGDTDTGDVDADSLYDTRIVYYVGYSILIAGLAVVWALDMAFDDFKNRK
mmetsp:Transcript_6372/g.10084  ORF Transcript_6372/g.10084 Transcript_6372/m.10084 type:complete len:354 (+) Transcript_6372:49-1110(+)|eukprot:CAMPEP_0202699894 /NCGR_PEP_ID=MMETSP1385-20130828/13111_1 /ASSEMBLY_ACC=CAM_ASM_000861 /TAXON_ID=933848 /ORGANISM="Elphidium margaritaceum" /LENGTH=353 /DNA_ID=CAMNT_0049356953 /DNA_START=29 /DNA_END=1090 /DNA_ORIENTATION=-